MKSTKSMSEIWYVRGIRCELHRNMTDRMGRAMVCVVLDGAVVGKGYSVKQAKERAAKRLL